MKRSYGLMASAVVIGLVVITFQNCSKGPSAVYSASDSASSSVSSASQADPVTSPTISPTAVSLKVVATTSASASIDCSDPAATMYTEVQNADANILLCAAFVLDMPASSTRTLRVNTCDTNAAFSPPQSDWAYHADIRAWKPVAGTTYLRNHPYIVPGTYTLYVKDAMGQVFKSPSVTVKHSGFENCAPAPSGPKWVYTQVQSCVGPTPPPAEIGAPCSQVGMKASNACGTATCQ